MPQWQRWSLWQTENRGFATHIDLGNGRTMRTEDLLDGHARRLNGASANAADQYGKSNLTTAVRVVAPQVAPLTDLAQTIAEKSTPAHPANKFRSDLQQALENTHRQQNVRRTLGIQPSSRKEKSVWQSRWFFLATVVMVLLTVGILRRRYRATSV